MRQVGVYILTGFTFSGNIVMYQIAWKITEFFLLCIESVAIGQINTIVSGDFSFQVASFMEAGLRLSSGVYLDFKWL